MPSLLPDLFTAFGMTALSAFAMVWGMWALGRPYWRQGLAWGMASTLLYGLAYVALALQSRQDLGWLQVAPHLLVSAAIGTFTLALHRFQLQQPLRRKAVVVALPLVATVLLAAWLLPQQTAQWHMLHAGITLVQNLYALWVLTRIRSSTPGRGWKLVIGAQLVHLTTNAVLAYAKASPLTVSAQAPGSLALAMWGVNMLLYMLLMVSSIGFLIMLRDRALVQDQDKSMLDPLTQLPNRLALIENLQRAIEQAAQLQQPLAVMVLDIDHFKNVNDNHGHLVGDHVIQSLARTLVQHGRASDFAARYGGEEFIVVLPNTQAREAFHLAERLCQKVRSAPIKLANGNLLHTTISVGVYAGQPTHGNAWERLVAAADEAMYVAKRNGRDRVAMSAAVTTMQTQAVRMH